MARLRSYLAVGTAGLLASPLSALIGAPAGVVLSVVLGCVFAVAALHPASARLVRG